MGSKKPFWIVFLTGLAIALLCAHLASQRGGLRASLLRPLPARPELFNTASREPVRSSITKSNAESSSVNPEAAPSNSREPAVVSPPPASIANESRDLKDSAHRLNTIESITNYADRIFSTEALAGSHSRTLNQQGLDQLDEQLPDGTRVTSWMGPDKIDPNLHVVRAQEAQLPNDEVIDRWFHENGAVRQVMHKYSEDRSVSIYYYDNGSVEAMRIVQNGREIFTKYDRDGRLIQKKID